MTALSTDKSTRSSKISINDNLLDEAWGNPGYWGSTKGMHMASGADPFFVPESLGDVHFGMTLDGRFTSKMPEMHGYVDDMTAFGSSLLNLAAATPGAISDFIGSRVQDHMANSVSGINPNDKGDWVEMAMRMFGGTNTDLFFDAADAVQSVDWTEPHNFLPALGMGADYVIPGLGAVFDIPDGMLYQYQDQPGMASLAYGSALLPYSLTYGGKTIKAGADVLGGPGTGEAISAYTKHGINKSKETIKKGIDLARVSNVDEFPNIIYPGKFDDIDIPIYDPYGGIYGQSNAGQIFDLSGNLLTTTGKSSLGVPRVNRVHGDTDNLDLMPEYFPETGIMRLPDGSILDPVSLDNPIIRNQLNQGMGNLLRYKTGPDAFKNAKLTYPHIFDNPNLPFTQKKFDSLIKSLSTDMISPNRLSIFPTMNYKTLTGSGDYMSAMGHYSPYGRSLGDIREGFPMIPGWIDPNMVLGQGYNKAHWNALFGHEMTHSLDNSIWDYSMRLLQREDPAEYARQMNKYQKRLDLGKPMNFKPGVDSPAYYDLQDMLYRGTTMSPTTHPHLYNPVTMGMSAGPKPAWFRGSQAEWEHAAAYYSDPTEILARRTEMNMPISDAQRLRDIQHWGATKSQGIPRWELMGGAPGMQDYYQYGRAAYEVDAFNPGLLKSDVWQNLYGMTPFVGYGSYQSLKPGGLLNYTTEQQGD